MSDVLALSPSGAELADLAGRVRRLSGTEEGAGRGDRRVIIGVVGSPGAGKSTFAEAMVRALGPDAVNVPMDGFHLADVELDRLGLRHRKGAPETFDAYGYAALLGRIAAWPGHIVYAPGFERHLEQPLAGELPVEPRHAFVITEGNYVLVDQPEWRAVRAHVDEVWYVYTNDTVRMRRLIDRHVEFGKTVDAATEWVRRIDEPNAQLIEQGRDRADLLIDLEQWGR